MLKKLISKLATVLSPALLPLPPLAPPPQETTEQRVIRLLAIPLVDLLPAQHAEFTSLSDLMMARANHWNGIAARLQEKADATVEESKRIRKFVDALDKAAAHLMRLKEPQSYDD